MQDGMLAEGLDTNMLVMLNLLCGLADSWLVRTLVQEAASTSFRGPDGHFRPAEQIESTDDVFIGGWVMPAPRYPSAFPTQPDNSEDASVGPNFTPPPRFPSPHLRQTRYPFVRQSDPLMDDTPLSQLSATERHQALNRRNRLLDPYLQLLCVPLLRHDD